MSVYIKLKTNLEAMAQIRTADTNMMPAQNPFNFFEGQGSIIVFVS